MMSIAETPDGNTEVVLPDADDTFIVDLIVDCEPARATESAMRRSYNPEAVLEAELAALVDEPECKADLIMCACNSGRTYTQCCKLQHSRERIATTPEELVRARYSAFANRISDYLIATTDPQGEERTQWTRNCSEEEWRRQLDIFLDGHDCHELRVGQTEYVGDHEAVVRFEADLCETGSTDLVTRTEDVHLRLTPCAGWLFMGSDVICGGWQRGPCGTCASNGQTMAYKLSEPSENYCR